MFLSFFCDIVHMLVHISCTHTVHLAGGILCLYTFYDGSRALSVLLWHISAIGCQKNGRRSREEPVPTHEKEDIQCDERDTNGKITSRGY